MSKHQSEFDSMLDLLSKKYESMRDRKDGAYEERNRVVALAARMALRAGHRVGLGLHDAGDSSWDEEWRTIVYLDLPEGQVSWHIHDSHRYLFAGLPDYPGTWDGHDTPEKYRRVDQSFRTSESLDNSPSKS